MENLVTTGYRMSLVRPGRRDEAPRHGSIGWIRQWIESVSDTLKGQLAPAYHRGNLRPHHPDTRRSLIGISALGLSSAEISARIYVSASTVKTTPPGL